MAIKLKPKVLHCAFDNPHMFLIDALQLDSLSVHFTVEDHHYYA